MGVGLFPKRRPFSRRIQEERNKVAFSFLTYGRVNQFRFQCTTNRPVGWIGLVSTMY